MVEIVARLQAREQEIEKAHGYKKGDRVAAFLIKEKPKEITFFGYGVYEGCDIPEAGDAVAAAIFQRGIPKIRLDTQQIIWGFECWWCSVTQYENRLAVYQRGGYTVKYKKWKGK